MVSTKELANRIAKRLNITKKDSEEVLKAILEEIPVAIMEDEDKTLNLTNFGKFSVKQVEGRVARDPRNGEPVTIEPHGSIKFKATKALKDFVK